MIALTLGPVNFMNYECPEGPHGFDSIGSAVKLVVLDFPGGDRTIQTFGMFPPERIKWSGIFTVDPTIGQDPNDRVAQIKSLVVAQQPVNLQIGQYSYTCMIEKFTPYVQLEFWLPYEIVIVPIQNLTAPTVGTPQPAPTIPQLTQQATDLNVLPGTPLPAPPIPQPITTINGPLAVPTNTGSTFNQGSLPTTSAFPNNPAIQTAVPIAIPNPLPPDIATGLSDFQTTLVNQIQAALGVVSAVNSTQLQASLAANQAALAPYIAGSNPNQAAAALYLSSTLTNTNTLLTPTSEPVQLNTVNPNLVQLADRYYGDTDDWQIIATANGLTLTNPIGIFGPGGTNPALIIPPPAA